MFNSQGKVPVFLIVILLLVMFGVVFLNNLINKEISSSPLNSNVPVAAPKQPETAQDVQTQPLAISSAVEPEPVTNPGTSLPEQKQEDQQIIYELPLDDVILVQ